MGQLEDMSLFVRIVEATSIARAADQLGIAKSAVSRRLSELENRLGTQLLTRTTRKMNLTEAGTNFYQQAIGILDKVDALNAQTQGIKSAQEGKLKITAPVSFGALHLTPIIGEFIKQYPLLVVDIDFTDRKIDLVEKGHELAIRIGCLPDSSLRARRIAPILHALVASPDYVKKHGKPETPDDISHFDFLEYTGSPNHGSLQVFSAKGQSQSIRLNTKIKANNGDFLRDMAIAGQGITMQPTFLLHQAIKAGKLVKLLPEYHFQEMNAYAVYPQSKFMSARCRLFIDFIIEKLGDNPYWDNQA